jgi:hypothetical protein
MIVGRPIQKDWSSNSHPQNMTARKLIAGASIDWKIVGGKFFRASTMNSRMD